MAVLSGSVELAACVRARFRSESTRPWASEVLGWPVRAPLRSCLNACVQEEAAVAVANKAPRGVFVGQEKVQSFHERGSV